MRYYRQGGTSAFSHYNANMRKVLITLEGKGAITLDHGLGLVLAFDWLLQFKYSPG